jgi:hypothetical protein
MTIRYGWRRWVEVATLWGKREEIDRSEVGDLYLSAAPFSGKPQLRGRLEGQQQTEDLSIRIGISERRNLKI